MDILIIILLIIAILIAFYFYKQWQEASANNAELAELRAGITLKEQSIQELKTALDKKAQQLESETQRHLTARLQSEQRIARLEAECSKLSQLLDESRQSQESVATLLEERFRNITTSILDERSEQLHKRSEESLTPLREDLERFRKSVAEAYNNESRERMSLQQEIQRLVEQSNRMSADANNLTQALRGNNKIQGNWGEMILDELLETSGLQKGKHYSIQEEYKDDETGKKLVPDVVVHYPNGGKMIIDSKVNLVAYMDYVNADDDDSKKEAAQRHLQAVKQQIKGLSQKHYSRHVPGAPDFVLLFIPNEPAYILAMQQDPKIWDEAFKQKVLLMNTTNLLASLKLAEELWRHEEQLINVEEMYQKVGDLYDKFCGYIETLEETTKKFESASKSLATAKNQLSEGKGNIINRFETLRRMGAKTKKRLADVSAKAKLLENTEDLNEE